MLPTTQFAYRKGLGTCDAILCVLHTLQSASDSEQEARIVQIDFSAAFERVNRQEILYRLSSVGIGGSVLSVLMQFLSNLSQFVLVNGCRSKLVNVVLTSCSFCTPRSFFSFWRIRLLVMLMTPL